MTASRSLALIGVKGGVGTSLLAANTARHSARSNRYRTALVDFTPSVSSQPSYLALKDVSRPLVGLKSFEGPFSPKILETYFASSPEGVLHIPASSPEGSLSPSALFPLLEKLLSVLDLVVLDLPPLSGTSGAFDLLGFCHRALVVSSSDPLCRSCPPMRRLNQFSPQLWKGSFIYGGPSTRSTPNTRFQRIPGFCRPAPSQSSRSHTGGTTWGYPCVIGRDFLRHWKKRSPY